MIGTERVRELAVETLQELERESGHALALLDDRTRSLPYGWVFFYESKGYLETGDPARMLGGNAPLLVTRAGEVHFTGTAQPLEMYLLEFERSGSPHPPRPELPGEVRITGWRYGLRKVSMTETIRDRTGMGLAAAKAITDAVLRGESAVVPVADYTAAVQLAAALRNLGAEARPAASNADEPAVGADAPRSST